MDKEYKTMCASIIFWMVILFFAMMLGACSRKTPVSEINDSIQQEVSELIDYANNNMAMDADKQMLINGARHCAMRAMDMEKVCVETVSAYRAEIAEWKMVAILVSIIAAFLGVAWIRK